MANPTALSHQTSMLALLNPESSDSIPLSQALDTEGPHYDSLVSAIRNTSSDERKGISAIFELLEIEAITRITLNTIAETLDDPRTVKSWNLDRYHEKRLEDPGGDPNEPDFFFRQYGSSKSRVILRLAAKDILARVRRLPSGPRTKLIGIFDSLPLHRQINDWVTRYDRRRWLAGETQKVSLESQRETGNGDRRKRQQETGPEQNAISKRQKRAEQQTIMKSSDQELLQPRTWSVAHAPYSRNSVQQVGISDRAQALPGIMCLQPQLSNIPLCQNKPSPRILEQASQRTDLIHLTIHQASPMAPAVGQPYYQNQHSPSIVGSDSNLSQVEGGHQGLPPQEQQTQQHQHSLADVDVQLNNFDADGGQDDVIYKEFLFMFEEEQ